MPKAKPALKNSDLITESIQTIGITKENVLKTIFDGPEKDIPVLTSIGYVNIPGTNKFISYIIKSKGREILNIETSEPDFRIISEDQAKSNFVSCFMPGEEG